MNKKVDFFIIGSQKAGTTSLYNYMAQHPDIFLPKVKENHFFVEDRMYAKGEEYFHKFYQEYDGQKVVGGAYVHMLPCPQSPARVKAYNPKAKIIVMLRNPIDRAYSAYNFAIKNGWEKETTPFLDTVAMENSRRTGNFTERTDLSYFYNGMYSQHLKRWLEHFPKEQILVMLDTELAKEREQSVNKAFAFVGVATNVEVELDVVHNKSGTAKFKSLHFLIRDKESVLKKIGRVLLPFNARYFLRTRIKRIVDSFNTTEKEYRKLLPEEKDALYAKFLPDMTALSEMLGRDFVNAWKPKKASDK